MNGCSLKSRSSSPNFFTTISDRAGRCAAASSIGRPYRSVELPDESSSLEVTITEYDRRGWGPGGHGLDWYCSGNPAAHIGKEPVYRSNGAELRELMGSASYDELVVRCDAHMLAVQ